MAGEMLKAMADGGEFSRAQYQAITVAFFRVIETSYVQDKMRPTRAETKRRFEILEQTFRMLRSEDFQWSTQRILDELPRALRAKLDRLPWDPSRLRSLWRPPT
jgi:hypothetical protein